MTVILYQIHASSKTVLWMSGLVVEVSTVLVIGRKCKFDPLLAWISGVRTAGLG